MRLMYFYVDVALEFRKYLHWNSSTIFILQIFIFIISNNQTNSSKKIMNKYIFVNKTKFILWMNGNFKTNCYRQTIISHTKKLRKEKNLGYDYAQFQLD